MPRPPDVAVRPSPELPVARNQTHKPYLFTYELSTSATLNYDAYRTARRISEMVLTLLRTMDGLELKDIAITRCVCALVLWAFSGLVGLPASTQNRQSLCQRQPCAAAAGGCAGAHAGRRGLLPARRLRLRAPVQDQGQSVVLISIE